MSPAISTKPKNKGQFVVSVAVCLGVLVLALAMFPTLSGAKLQSPTASATQSLTKTKRTTPQRFVPGEVLVRYRSEPTARSKSGSRVMSTREGRAISLRVEDFGVSGFVHGLRKARVAAADTLAAVEALQRDPDVLYAEPNYIYRASVTNPNDTLYAGNQGNLTQIGLPFAWDSNTGSSAIVVAVLDQGINTTHEDLTANIWTNPSPGAAGMGITNDVNGYNFVANTGTVFGGMDSETHATHVAGIIGGRGNNNLGIAGVNWDVKLMSLKFLDEEGFGSSADAVRACAYAKEMRRLWDVTAHSQGANIKVINASFGEKSFSQAFLDAINELNDIGPNHAQILFVAAAGNIGDGTREPNNDLIPEYPASYNAPNVIAVASVNASDAFSTSFSHFGATSVDLAAPGEGSAGAGVLSTTPPCSNPNGPNCHPSFPANPTPTQSTYSLFRGTSVSAPHVSGAAALLFAEAASMNPVLNLTAVQAKNLLLMNGDVQPSLIDKTLTGRRLNAETSILALQELPQLDLAAPGAATNLHINSQNGRNLSLGWTSSGDDGSTGTASLYEIDFVEGSNVTPLKGVVPIASGGGQIANVTVPFRHTSGSLRVRAVDNVGKETLSTTLAVGIPLSSADPYAISDPGGASPALTTGGTKLTDVIQDPDDDYVSFNFPAGFTFPFFGVTFDKVTLSTNGSLYFTPPLPPDRDDGSADDVPSSPGALGGLKMIAGLWDDLDLSTSARADAGIYFRQLSPTTVVFRWQAVPCNFVGTACTGTTPVNFEVELNTNGVIKTRYGAGNTGLFPTVGIGGGEQDGYVIISHTSEEVAKNLGNAGEVTFTPRATTVSTIELSPGPFSITESQASLSVSVTRGGDTTGVATVDYATSDTAGAAQCTAIGTAASSRCDYLTSKGTLTFAPGQTTALINIPILDDNYDENDESFTLTLTNPAGVTLGTQTSATLTINDNDTGTPTNNPIDTASFFVRQHYVDFLNREPDAGGLAFWTNEITGCGTDAQCIDVKRTNVSAAFFLAIEFQETGYLVYRMYKSGFGNMAGAPVPINFTDFLRDTQGIGQGVVVGAVGWEAKLEANKQAYALAFVQRADFQAAFPSTMSSAAFVDKLIVNAGGANVIQPGERTTLEGVLGNIPFDLSRRAAVLRAVAEDSDLRAAEFNKAFVLMQYFGYLRRSPNDAPDNDFGGYNFWLNKLNDAGGDFVRSDMVKSFIVSGEYRHRFGP